jgi:hypothetical protein
LKSIDSYREHDACHSVEAAIAALKAAMIRRQSHETFSHFWKLKIYLFLKIGIFVLTAIRFRRAFRFLSLALDLLNARTAKSEPKRRNNNAANHHRHLGDHSLALWILSSRARQPHGNGACGILRWNDIGARGVRRRCSRGEED